VGILVADLHIHSTASDGSYSPQEIVAEALACGLSAISITDHDTVEGLKPAIEAARGTGLELVPGVELNTDWEGTEVHILGYYLDYDAPWLQNFFSKLKQAREKRVRAILRKLNDLGISLSYEQVEKVAGSGSIGRPHIARVIADAGYASSPEDAFEQYLRREAPGYVPRQSIDPFTAIDIILEAGGVPVLAHPGLMGRDDLIPEFVEKGIIGLEVFYPKHTPEMIAKYSWYCRKFGLVITGGSDFHGPGFDYPPIGSCTVPQRTVEILKLLSQKIGGGIK